MLTPTNLNSKQPFFNTHRRSRKRALFVRSFCVNKRYRDFSTTTADRIVSLLVEDTPLTPK